MTRDPRQQCARLAVPLDHRRPNGPHIAIEVSRIRSGAAHPLALMVGQGGPGFGGLDLPSAEETALPPEVAARTDIYGMDYRGIGASSPLDCDIAPADRSEATGVPYPAADGSIDANTAWAARIAADCAAHAGDELRYVNTVNIARDIDSLRVALGLPTLSYTGTSYGTFVGAVYASLYPTTSGRVLLNSVVPPGGVKEAIEHKGQAVETAFPPFADWVAARDATYHLGTTRTAVRSAVLATADHLNSHPILLPDGAPLTGNLLLEAQEALLEQSTYYPLLAGLLKDARTGSLPSGTGSDLPWSQLLTDNFVSAQDAVVCNDSAWPRDPAHYRTAVTRNAARYPLTAGSPRNVWPCAFWTTRSSDRALTPNPHGPANILLLQNTADPSTAPSGAVATRNAFGHRAALVSVDAVGHGVDMTQPCVAEQVTRFLLHPGPPRPATCPGIRRQTP
ncbi:alpha/beta fold hydrolase [Actinacidiphila alni]|uniref:alpha/beta fold hydrolase n=1 Tax=Actinacidiphila alni TaxID=380248 RepID=UPI003452BAB8